MLLQAINRLDFKFMKSKTKTDRLTILSNRNWNFKPFFCSEMTSLLRLERYNGYNEHISIVPWSSLWAGLFKGNLILGNKHKTVISYDKCHKIRQSVFRTTVFWIIHKLFKLSTDCLTFYSRKVLFSLIVEFALTIVYCLEHRFPTCACGTWEIS